MTRVSFFPAFRSHEDLLARSLRTKLKNEQAPLGVWASSSHVVDLTRERWAMIFKYLTSWTWQVKSPMSICRANGVVE